MARESRIATATAEKGENRTSPSGQGNHAGAESWPPPLAEHMMAAEIEDEFGAIIAAAENTVSDITGSPLAGAGMTDFTTGANGREHTLRGRESESDGYGFAAGAASPPHHIGMADMQLGMADMQPFASQNDGDGKPPADEELLELLQGLNASIDAAHHVLHAATNTFANDAEGLEHQDLEEEIVEREEWEREDFRLAARPLVPPLPEPAPARKTYRRLLHPLGALVAGVVVLFGWFAWQLYGAPLLFRDGLGALNWVLYPAPGPEGVGEERAPTLADAASPVGEGMAAAAEQRGQTLPTPLPKEVRGRAGEPIPLGIKLPQQTGDAEVSLMVQGIPENARLSAGRRVGGGTWILSAEQVPDAALIVPEDFAAGEVDLHAYIVMSDGRIPETYAVTAAVEPAAASLAQREPTPPDANAPVASEPSEPLEPTSATAEQTATAPAFTASPSQASEPTPTSEPETSVQSAQPYLQPEQASPAPETPAQQEATAAMQDPAPQPLEERVIPAPGDAAAQAPQPADAAQLDETTVTTRPVPVDETPTAVLDGRAGQEEADPGSAANDPRQEAPADEATGAVASATPPVPEPSPEPAEETQLASTDAAQSDTASTNGAAPTRTEKVNTHVNMRAQPDNDAAVVTVVPSGRAVGVVDCDVWCEVVYNDKRGWIYKGFLGAKRSTERAAPSPARTSAPRATRQAAPRATRQAAPRATRQAAPRSAPRATRQVAPRSAPPPAPRAAPAATAQQDQSGPMRNMMRGIRSFFDPSDTSSSAR